MFLPLQPYDTYVNFCKDTTQTFSFAPAFTRFARPINDTRDKKIFTAEVFIDHACTYGEVKRSKMERAGLQFTYFFSGKIYVNICTISQLCAIL